MKALSKIQTSIVPTVDDDMANKKFVADSMGAAGLGDMTKAVYDTTNNGIVDNAEKLNGQLPAYYAPVNSPALTGTPTAPTAVAGTATTQLATTAFAHGTHVFSEEGYKIHPDGMIEQWGTHDITYATGTSLGPPANYAFPIPFPNECLNVHCTPSKIYLYSSAYNQLKATEHHNGGASAYGKQYYNLSGDPSNYVIAGTYRVVWHAIGY